jgi:hypothetical protein
MTVAKPKGSFVEEALRLKPLNELGIVLSGADPVIAALVDAACVATVTPVGLVTLLDSERQRFKSRRGVEGEGSCSAENVAELHAHERLAVIMAWSGSSTSTCRTRFRARWWMTFPVDSLAHGGKQEVVGLRRRAQKYDEIRIKHIGNHRNRVADQAAALAKNFHRGRVARLRLPASPQSRGRYRPGAMYRQEAGFCRAAAVPSRAIISLPAMASSAELGG